MQLVLLGFKVPYFAHLYSDSGRVTRNVVTMMTNSLLANIEVSGSALVTNMTILVTVSPTMTL